MSKSVNIKYRLVYEKGEQVRYLGHLDLLRAFTRSIRRSKLPVAYSAGFNPHQVLSFEMPLGVGATGERELCYLSLTEPLPSDDVKEALSAAMPKGITIHSVAGLFGGSDKSEVVAARYSLYMALKNCVNIDNVEAFFNKESVLVKKKTKAAITEINIMQHIHGHNATVAVGETDIACEVVLSAGNSFNIKPQLVVDAMSAEIEGFEPLFVKPHRLELIAK